MATALLAGEKLRELILPGAQDDKAGALAALLLQLKLELPFDRVVTIGTVLVPILLVTLVFTKNFAGEGAAGGRREEWPGEGPEAGEGVVRAEGEGGRWVGEGPSPAPPSPVVCRHPAPTQPPTWAGVPGGVGHVSRHWGLTAVGCWNPHPDRGTPVR